MNKLRTTIYTKYFPASNEIVYCGIDFAEFLRYLPRPIENLLVISGGDNVISLDSCFERGLEFFVGASRINKLSKENIRNLGSFCFVDCISPTKARELTEEQLAELLYLGHM